MMKLGMKPKLKRKRPLLISGVTALATTILSFLSPSTWAADEKYDFGYSFKIKESKYDWTRDSDDYPEGALREAFQSEAKEIKRQEEAANQLRKQQEDYENKKVEAERAILAKQISIRNLHIKQEQSLNAIDDLRAEMLAIDSRKKTLEADLLSLEKSLEERNRESSFVLSQLETTKNSLNVQLDQLKEARSKNESKIHQLRVEMQKMKAETATFELQISSAEKEMVRTRVALDETQQKWNATKLSYELAKEENQKAGVELAELERRLRVARSDLRDAEQEFAHIDSARKSSTQALIAKRQQMTAEMIQTENRIARIKSDTTAAESEIARNQSESNQLGQNLALVKERNEKAINDMNEARALVLESRLKVANIKSELIQETSSQESAKMKHDAFAVQMRSLASLANDSKIGAQMKTFVVSKTCTIRGETSSSSPGLGQVSAGERLQAESAPQGYVKILNSSGKEAYVLANCGDFAR